MNWATSTRRSRLPRNWPKLVAMTKHRAKGKCQAQTHVADCDGYGRECDHIQAGDDHRMVNLQWLSTPCHKAKTQAEAAARRGSLRLPREQHPTM